MLSPHRRQRWRFVAIGCMAVALPLALERLGVLEPSYLFRDGMLQVLPHAVRLPELPTIAVLTISSLSSIVAPSVFVGIMRSAFDQAERRLRVHAWHLQRLVPDEALGGMQQPVSAPAA
jgi:hypothetical protein